VSAPEKRGVGRIAPYVTPCRVSANGRRFSAFMADLSPKGARVSCDQDCLAVGDTVTIEARLGRKVGHVELPGVVAWVQPAAQGSATFGVRFADLSPAVLKQVEEVVQEFQRLAARLA
jgi:Tfp pilus assembly protein PilZ